MNKISALLLFMMCVFARLLSMEIEVEKKNFWLGNSTVFHVFALWEDDSPEGTSYALIPGRPPSKDNVANATAVHINITGRLKYFDLIYNQSVANSKVAEYGKLNIKTKIEELLSQGKNNWLELCGHVDAFWLTQNQLTQNQIDIPHNKTVKMQLEKGELSPKLSLNNGPKIWVENNASSSDSEFIVLQYIDNSAFPRSYIKALAPQVRSPWYSDTYTISNNPDDHVTLNLKSSTDINDLKTIATLYSKSLHAEIDPSFEKMDLILSMFKTNDVFLYIAARQSREKLEHPEKYPIETITYLPTKKTRDTVNLSQEIIPFPTHKPYKQEPQQKPPSTLTEKVLTDDEKDTLLKRDKEPMIWIKKDNDAHQEIKTARAVYQEDTQKIVTINSKPLLQQYYLCGPLRYVSPDNKLQISWHETYPDDIEPFLDSAAKNPQKEKDCVVTIDKNSKARIAWESRDTIIKTLEKESAEQQSALPSTITPQDPKITSITEQKGQATPATRNKEPEKAAQPTGQTPGQFLWSILLGMWEGLCAFGRLLQSFF
jgi:hypothetical protein